MSKLGFADYDFASTGYAPPPPPSLNGGLYTGQPFQKDAPWGNVPVTPDATPMIHDNLRRGNTPPFQAIYQYPGTRQGNSKVHWKGLHRYEGTAINSGPFHIYCAPCHPPHDKDACYCEDICPNAQTALCNSTKCVRKPKQTDMLSKYYYVA
jgi:hypothetical protein